ncbi:hypothetical protein DTO164E3_5884 [Paecilomyces variotii]|nr:hypothetical protein DTO032I3_6408 [Paecilomyces variotii]KAJ9197170.1 hypothetical protein DTO164E3_5884 [Paecilomyces variotii]KAJ9275065.1 hypothetical protein DTO021D3_8040 [Paecilomyces variotii]KAJ9313097.1 hypothetical protein DTO271D3_6699 [Paecilomyces variotii]KAJ9341162.1 hypothetical protein DTO027B6_6294 [Paecilomyces variotii]
MTEMSLSDSDLSSLSSAPPTDDESIFQAVDQPVGIQKYFKKGPSPESPPPPKRPASPPHEYVLADNPDIAFIVMFRARFHDVFPRSLPHYGPQDIERGVADITPGDHIERLLCALLGLVLNRKKDVERGHFQRALEEAVQTHVSQWPRAWEGKNPLHGGRTFATMSPEERLRLLKTLILWSLSSSDAVQAKIKESYKQSRRDDDLNQPLSVQPWGSDDLKRRYWLIEGLDDTHFRLYRESNPALKTNTWWSVAGTIDELKAVADKLEKDRSQQSKRLSEKIRLAIPRFEGSEEKRRRRDYRLARKAAFSRPEPGFSLYEGRTRGKRLKYTYSDDEDIFSDGLPPSTRRSTRNASGVSTPGEPAGPTFTASGRQVRTRAGGIYGESMLSGQRRDDDASAAQNSSETGRRTRNGWSSRANRYGDSDDEMDEGSDGASSGNEWQGGDDEEEEDHEFDGDDENLSQDELANGEENPSLVVQLRYGKGKKLSSPGLENGTTQTPSENAAANEATQVEPQKIPQETTPKNLQEQEVKPAMPAGEPLVKEQPQANEEKPSEARPAEEAHAQIPLAPSTT